MPIRANGDQRLCYYPMCRYRAMWTPLVKIPTWRTDDQGNKVSSVRRIQQADGTITEEDQPTILVFNNICDAHKKVYNLSYWIKAQDWRDIIEEAKRRDLEIPELHLVVVEFIPLGDVLMHSGYMEMDRK